MVELFTGTKTNNYPINVLLVVAYQMSDIRILPDNLGYVGPPENRNTL